MREELDALRDPRPHLLAVDEQPDLAELVQLDATPHRQVVSVALLHEPAADLVPGGARARLGVHAPREHRGVVGQRLQQPVLGPEQRAAHESEIRGCVGTLLVPGPPPRLGEVDRRGRQLEAAFAAPHVLDGAFELRQRFVIASEHEQRLAAPALGDLRDEAEALAAGSTPSGSRISSASAGSAEDEGRAWRAGPR